MPVSCQLRLVLEHETARLRCCRMFGMTMEVLLATPHSVACYFINFIRQLNTYTYTKISGIDDVLSVYTTQLRYNNMFRQQFSDFMVSFSRGDLE